MQSQPVLRSAGAEKEDRDADAVLYAGGRSPQEEIAEEAVAVGKVIHGVW